MSGEITVLAATAASIGFLHTLFGPDHYLPFIVMSRAREWSLSKTALVTALCGVGHVAGSIVLGMVGVAMGIAVNRLEVFEASRGSIAAWLLIGFGLVYSIWGIRRAIRNRPHAHLHWHNDGMSHKHEHTHSREHAHVHERGSRSITPWVLFTIFVLGPCEPLIPILMYPAAKSSMSGLVLVTSVFAVVTIATMLAVVLVSSFGVSLVPLGRIERFTHALAGAAIFLSGVSIQFLGL